MEDKLKLVEANEPKMKALSLPELLVLKMLRWPSSAGRVCSYQSRKTALTAFLNVHLEALTMYVSKHAYINRTVNLMQLFLSY